MTYLRLLRLATVLLVGAALVGCGDDEDDRVVPGRFAFDSGGAHHLEGHGAWRWSMERSAGGASQVDVRHQVRDETTTYAPFQLTAAEDTALWEAVAAAGLGSLAPDERPGVPDEVVYTFTLERGGVDARVELWQNDLAAYPALGAVVARLRALIEAHCGVRPVF